MKTEDRFKALLSATPEQLAAVDAILAGKIPPESPVNMRLLRIGEAAAVTGLSRVTLWRACSEGMLRTVEIRRGSRRIPESALRDFVEGRAESMAPTGNDQVERRTNNAKGGATME